MCYTIFSISQESQRYWFVHYNVGMHFSSEIVGSPEINRYIIGNGTVLSPYTT